MRSSGLDLLYALLTRIFPSGSPGRENKWWLRSATFHSLQFFQIAAGDLKELEGYVLDRVGIHHLSLVQLYESVNTMF